MSAKRRANSRQSLIETVQTPLSFFTLGVLAVEGLLTVVAMKLTEPARDYIAGGILLLLFVLVAVVTYLLRVNPDVLFRRSTETQATATAMLTIRQPQEASEPQKAS